MAKLTALLNAATTDLAPSGLVEEEGGKATFPVNQRLSFCKCTAIRNEMLSVNAKKNQQQQQRRGSFTTYAHVYVLARRRRLR